MEKILSRTDAQDLEDYKQAAAVEAGLRREFLARAKKAEAEIERLRAALEQCSEIVRGGTGQPNAVLACGEVVLLVREVLDGRWPYNQSKGPERMTKYHAALGMFLIGFGVGILIGQIL